MITPADPVSWLEVWWQFWKAVSCDIRLPWCNFSAYKCEQFCTVQCAFSVHFYPSASPYHHKHC